MRAKTADHHASRVLPMVPALFAEIAKRFGLSKLLVRTMFKRISSPQTKARAFAGYRPTEHDVFVATFGKSGTNWMMQIAQQIAHLGRAEFDHIHDVVPWPDAPSGGPIPLSDPGPLESSPTRLRVIKTHLETAFVPYHEKASYLTVLRDPKEVVVSSYYFLGGILGVLNRVSIDDWFELFVRSGSMASSWVAHTAGFWEWRNRPNALMLNFAEVGRAPRASIERVAATLGVVLSDAQLEMVVERSSIEYMKAHESQFAPPQSPFSRGEPTRMVRRGVSGGSDELLTRAQQAEIDRVCQAGLVALGSDFPYATQFQVVTAR